MISPSIKKLLCLALVLLAVCGSYSAASGQTKKDREKADNLVKTGSRAFDQKDFRTAIARFDEAIVANQKNGDAYFRKGRAHYFLGEYEQAVAAFDLAFANGYKPLEIYKNRWAANNKLKRYDQALADVNKVLAQEPNNQEYLVAAADINFENGSYKEAAAAYEKVIPKAPNAADLYYKVAFAKSKAGDIDGQATAAEAAIARNTQYRAESLMLVGDARYAQRKFPEAIQAYSASLASKPDKLDTYRRLAELYRSQNELDKAIATLEKAKSSNPLSGEVYMDLSLLYSMAEMKDEAIATGRSATIQLPNNALAHTRLCRALSDSERYAMAIDSCTAALKLAPEDGETLFYLGRANTELKTPARKAEGEKYYQRALASLQRAVKERPDDADALYMLGNVYADTEKWAEAIETYERVLALNPKFTRAHYNIGIIMLRKNDKPGALARYDTLMNSDKNLAQRLKKWIDTL